MKDNHALLTMKEVSELLRTEMAAVAKMLNSGELAGFKIDNEWRIPKIAITDFIEKRLKSERLESTQRTLNDSTMWAKEIRKSMPEYENELRKKTFSKGTLGEFLQQGLNKLDSVEDDTNES